MPKHDNLQCVHQRQRLNIPKSAVNRIYPGMQMTAVWIWEASGEVPEHKIKPKSGRKGVLSTGREGEK